MKPPVLFVLLAAMTTLAGCDKKDAAPTPSPATGASAPATTTTVRAPDAGVAAKAPTGPFELRLTPAGAAAAGAPTDVIVEVRDGAGARVTALDRVHDEALHLVVVSPDLGFLARVHAAPQPDGTLRTSLTLPHPATYVAFADFKPAGGALASARGALTLPGEAPAAAALKAVTLPARGTFDGLDVALRAKAPLVQGTDAIVEFELFDKGAPVADLQPLRGARGQSAWISADATQYVHGHPLGGSGSKVQFHTTLPAAGLYKVWAEFRPAGKPVVASFVVEVLAEAPHGHDHGDDGHGHDHGDEGHDHGDKAGAKGHDHGDKSHDHGDKGHGHSH